MLSNDGRQQNLKTNHPDHEWRQALKLAWMKPAELLDHLQLEACLLDGIDQGQREFPLLAPAAFVGQIEKGNPFDPLFLQIFPQAVEKMQQKDLLQDPVGDLASKVSPALIHKYKGRALVITTGACAIHCRYCFRRHFPYSKASENRTNWQQSVNYIKQNPGISEVILSGGDPLMLSTKQLFELSHSLASLKQIKTLRIHSRIVTTLPERVNSEFLDWASQQPFRLVIVHHINHANEIGAQAKSAIRALTPYFQQQLNQAVLLKNVNDNFSVLFNLSEALFANNILPYYLHQMDPVASAGHFTCSDKSANKLMTKLRQNLPGYLVPKLVREIAGEESKTPV